MSVPLYQAKAAFFRALGHPARIRVLELLSERPMAVHALLATIQIEPSNLSQQLAVLRVAGLVEQHRQSREVIYSIAVPEVRDLLLAARRILQTRRVDETQMVDEVTRPEVAAHLTQRSERR